MTPPRVFVNRHHQRAETTFIVVTPNASVSVDTNGPVALDSCWAIRVLALRLGGCNGSPRIVFHRSGDTNIGAWHWLQLVGVTTRALDCSDSQWYRRSGVGLDVASPYLIEHADGSAEDSPGEGFVEGTCEMSHEMAFSMFLMFKPPGVGSIWIPTKQVDWGWGARLTNAVPVIVSGCTYFYANVTNAVGFPVWTNNYLNWTFAPE